MSQPAAPNRRRRKWPLAVVGLLVGVAAVAASERHDLLAWHYARELRTGPEEDRQGNADRLAGLGEPAVPRLVGCLTSDEAGVCAAARGALEKLVREWGPADPRTAKLVDRALADPAARSMAGRQATLRLLAALLGAGVECGGRVRPVVESAAKSDAAETRLQAVVLAMRPGVDAGAAVVPLLDDPAADVRRAAVLALGPLRDGVALVEDDELLPRLHDEDGEVRRLAEMALRSRGRSTRDILMGKLAAARKPAERHRLLLELSGDHELNLNAWLDRLSRDADPAVRAGAARVAADRHADLGGRLAQMSARRPGRHRPADRSVLPRPAGRRPVTGRLIVIGASARAAAESAGRAGLVAWCADLFADADHPGDVVRRSFADYPAGLVDLVERSAPAGPVAYLGGLENHPDLLTRLAATRVVWGCAADAVRAVRDPFAVAGWLAAAGLPCPDVRSEAGDGEWLSKPLHGAGGLGICRAASAVRRDDGSGAASPRRFLSGRERRGVSPPAEGPTPAGLRRAAPETLDRRADAAPLPIDRYYQRFVPGVPHGAVFAAVGGDSHFVAVSRMLVGEPGTNAKPFAYAGSVGPVPLADATRHTLTRIGQTVARRAGLRGLFGIDFVLAADGTPWPVEVNPRYAASVEVLEHACGWPALRAHRAAFEPADYTLPAPARRVVGKAILYAERDGTFPAWGVPKHDPWDVPDFADVPRPREPLTAGWPILTVFAVGSTVEECIARLHNRIEVAKSVVAPPASRG